MNNLFTELTTDPMGLGYAPLIVSRNDAGCELLLNDATKFTRPDWVSVSEFNTWCASHNEEYQNIKALAANSSNPYNSAADAILRCLNGAINTGALNLADVNVMNLLNAWPFADTTGATKAALIALGTFPASRAQVLGISATIDDISNALNKGY
jgi:hypothetical protein